MSFGNSAFSPQHQTVARVGAMLHLHPKSTTQTEKSHQMPHGGGGGRESKISQTSVKYYINGPLVVRTPKKVQSCFLHLSENSSLRNVIVGEEEMKRDQFSDQFIIKTISQVKSCFQSFLIIVTWCGKKIKLKQVLIFFTFYNKNIGSDFKLLMITSSSLTNQIFRGIWTNVKS